jgi:hypothetical protein
MNTLSITPKFGPTCEKSSCVKERIYLIQIDPFKQTFRDLATFNTWNEQVQPGQYRISLQYFAKTKQLPVTVTLHDSSITEILTFGKFLYFEVTPEYTLKSGNVEEFTRLFNLRRQAKEKETTKFWNTYWFFLHTLALHYPETPTQEHKDDARQLFLNIRNNGLPCTICAAHFGAYTGQHPFEDAIQSQTALFKYLFDLHNDVNKRNNKQPFTLDKAYTIYKNLKPALNIKFDTDIVKLVDTHTMHTLPRLMNGQFRNVLKREFGLL